MVKNSIEYLNHQNVIKIREIKENNKKILRMDFQFGGYIEIYSNTKSENDHTLDTEVHILIPENLAKEIASQYVLGKMLGLEFCDKYYPINKIFATVGTLDLYPSNEEPTEIILPIHFRIRKGPYSHKKVLMEDYWYAKLFIINQVCINFGLLME